MTTFIALLRGINVGGHNKVPMTELRALCEELGFANVQSYIQSGNLVFQASDKADTVEAKLEKAIESRFGIAISVLVRTAQSWPTYLKGNPFLEASAKEANLVMMTLSKRPPNKDAVSSLRERAKNGERIESADDAIWIHFPEGVARSKLAPGLMDRLVASPVTARNWRTVQKLAEMAGVDGASEPGEKTR